MSVSSSVVPFEVQSACHTARRGAAAADAARGRPFSDATRLPRRGVAAGQRAACCRNATPLLMLIALFLAAALNGRALAQAIAIAPPGPQEAMEAWKLVDAWVRAGKVDEAAAAPAKVAAASVTLRLDGSVFGRGVALETDARPLHTAAQAAIEEALSRIPATSALRDQIRAEALARATISLELAGPMIPVTLATYDEADMVINPGLEGVAARFGDRVAGMFPEWMLVSGLMPGDGLVACISKASGDAALAVRVDPRAQPRALAREHGAVFYRFRTTHLAQVESGGTPRFLHRCDLLVQPSEIDTAAVRSMADDMAAWLIGHDAAGVDRDDLTVLGGRYEITTNKQATTLVFEQALAALALAEYAMVLDGPGRDAAIERAHALTATLLEQAGNGSGWTDPVAAAFTRIAMVRLAAAGRPVAPPSPLTVPQMDAVADACWTGGEWVAKLPEAARSIIALSVAERAAASGDAQLRERAEAMVRSIYRETGNDRLVSHMPWVGRAELLLATDAQQVPAAAALRQMRDQVWRHQVTFEDAGVDDVDLMGGIVFTAAPEPRPTWHSVRPAVFLAQAMGDPRLTDDDEVLREVARMTRMTRFIHQLAVGDGLARIARSPTRAEGGVRAALWELEQPPEATALSLMFLTEVIRSGEKAAARAAANGG